MAETANLGIWLISILVIIVASLGLGTVFAGFSETYGVTRGPEQYASMDSFQYVANITNDINDNLQETGITDESSASKVISVGWNSAKLFMTTPLLFSDFLSSIAVILNVDMGGISMMALALMIVVILVLYTLVYFVLTGGAG